MTLQADYKILEIINPDMTPDMTPESITTPYSKYDITNLLKSSKPYCLINSIVEGRLDFICNIKTYQTYKY